MTVTHVEKGYLESDYLDTPYLGVDVDGYVGQQTQFVISKQPATGMQCHIHIVDRPYSQGQQANLVIATGLKLTGQQANFVIETLRALGQQASFSVANDPESQGQQANLIIATGESARGMQYNQDNFAHQDCQGYLEGDGYLEGAYLAHRICAHGGMQANFSITELAPRGMQALFQIVDRLRAQGQQAQFVIENEIAYGMQAELISLAVLGMQVTVSLYNTNRLRILCEFPSRGISTTGGTNAWGNPRGTGQNWKASSTETGDFDVSNLNTDIVEQVWRSNGATGVNLDCDTERTQGVFLDTLAILNHNITSSADITLVGSNSSTFASIGIAVPLQARDDDPNIYYIAPTLPTTGYRYWRVQIADSTNPDGYLQIGTIIFGAANIFFGECFVDEVEFQLKDYTDTVNTEGFTNVANSRALKKMLRLDFRSLSFLRANFRLMRSMFRNERTVLKCLWIPTPDASNQEYTARFAVFAKLVQIPSERHNHKGGDADYVSFGIELDESK